MAMDYSMEALIKLRENTSPEDLTVDVLSKFIENLPYSPELLQFIEDWHEEMKVHAKDLQVRQHEQERKLMMEMKIDLEDDDAEWLRFLKLAA